MKRQWNRKRVVLAMSLLCIAGLAFACWPKPSSACCQLPLGDIVGFDEARKWIYTTTMHDEVQVLDCYDVNSGVLLSSCRVPFPAMKGRSEAAPWPCILSPDKLFLIGMSNLSDEVCATRLSQMTDQHPTILTSDVQRWSFAYGFSQDGRSLLFSKSGDRNLDVVVNWDLEANTQSETTITVSHLPTGYSGPVSNVLPPEEIQLTVDRRYLAAILPGNNCVIYNLQENKVVFCDNLYAPSALRFSRDGKRIIFIGGNPIFENHACVWYQLVDGKWMLNGKKQLPFEKDEFLHCSCDDYFVTILRVKAGDRSWALKLPEFCQKLIQMFPVTDEIKFRFWDLETGEERKGNELRVPLQTSNSSIGYYFWEVRIKISDDAQYVGLKLKDHIEVWQTAPRRSLVSWAIISGLVLLASWVAWPWANANYRNC